MASSGDKMTLSSLSGRQKACIALITLNFCETTIFLLFLLFSYFSYFFLIFFCFLIFSLAHIFLEENALRLLHLAHFYLL